MPATAPSSKRPRVDEDEAQPGDRDDRDRDFNVSVQKHLIPFLHGVVRELERKEKTATCALEEENLKLRNRVQDLEATLTASKARVATLVELSTAQQKVIETMSSSAQHHSAELKRGEALEATAQSDPKGDGALAKDLSQSAPASQVGTSIALGASQDAIAGNSKLLVTPISNRTPAGLLADAMVHLEICVVGLEDCVELVRSLNEHNKNDPPLSRYDVDNLGSFIRNAQRSHSSIKHECSRRYSTWKK